MATRPAASQQGPPSLASSAKMAACSLQPRRVRFVKRLRLTALRTPKKTVREAMNGVKARIGEIIVAKGGNVKRD